MNASTFDPDFLYYIRGILGGSEKPGRQYVSHRASIRGQSPLTTIGGASATACPAQTPDAHAHWKLNPPSCPVTSTTSPMKNNPGTLRLSMVLLESSPVSTPPAVTSAF